MQTNKRPEGIRTHEGARAKAISPEKSLRRSLMACLLWEDQFYEDGEYIAERIKRLAKEVTPDVVKSMAIEARTQMNLRHAPLLLLVALAEQGALTADLVHRVINRADEMGELISIWWKDGKRPIPAQMKKGIASAFEKFNRYQLAKYQAKKKALSLRDVMFLTHPKPSNKEREIIYGQIAGNILAPPDTWEVGLSAGDDKRQTFERLINDNKLGALALLRNLRNMQEAQVNPAIIQRALASMNTSRVLPFRFIAAARYTPSFERDLENALFRACEGLVLEKNITLLVDVSGSMNRKLSSRSDMNRIDAACGLAMILREISSYVRVFTFSNSLVEVPSRRGFALRDAIVHSQNHGGTNLGGALRTLFAKVPSRGLLIVITDEQSRTPVPDPQGRAYMINVASYQNGVGYGPWNHIDGFSEAVVKYIIEREEEVDYSEIPTD